MADQQFKSELSPAVIEALHRKFSGDEREQVGNMLREFHWKLQPDVDERIHLDILYAANDLVAVRKLVNLAKRDWRDLIVATEYELREGKLVQTEWSHEMARKRQAQYDAAKH